MTVHLGDISEKIIFDKNILDVRRENFIPGICYVIAKTINNPFASIACKHLILCYCWMDESTQ